MGNLDYFKVMLTYKQPIPPPLAGASIFKERNLINIFNMSFNLKINKK